MPYLIGLSCLPGDFGHWTIRFMMEALDHITSVLTRGMEIKGISLTSVRGQRLGKSHKKYMTESQ